jgi:hypothetical protein
MALRARPLDELLELTNLITKRDRSNVNVTPDAQKNAGPRRRSTICGHQTRALTPRHPILEKSSDSGACGDGGHSRCVTSHEVVRDGEIARWRLALFLHETRECPRRERSSSPSTARSVRTLRSVSQSLRSAERSSSARETRRHSTTRRCVRATPRSLGWFGMHSPALQEFQARVAIGTTGFAVRVICVSGGHVCASRAWPGGPAPSTSAFPGRAGPARCALRLWPGQGRNRVDVRV